MSMYCIYLGIVLPLCCSQESSASLPTCKTSRAKPASPSPSRLIIERFANITDGSVIGVRAPYLRVGGNTQFQMMNDQFFVYDSSIAAPLSRVPVWPYTLLYRSSPENSLFHSKLMGGRARVCKERQTSAHRGSTKLARILSTIIKHCRSVHLSLVPFGNRIFFERISRSRYWMNTCARRYRVRH